MNRWVHKLTDFSPAEAELFVFDPHWVLFRDRIKTYSTERKLDNLEIYRAHFLTHNPESEQRRMEVQTSSYIYGLMLTGYLTLELKVTN